MGSRVRSKLLVAVAVVALALSAGCGENDNNGNGNDNDGGPNPTRTATPTPTPLRTATPTQTSVAVPTPTITATPAAATTVDVIFDVDSFEDVLNVDITVTYPTGKGNFQGSGTGVQCTAVDFDDAPVGNFLANDQDAGTMFFTMASATPLSLPVTITCKFDQVGGQTLEDTDVGTTVTNAGSVAPGDVDVAVSIG